MAQFEIKDEELSSLAGKVVVVTGGSSGIGLATTQLLLKLGASVVNGDLNPPAQEHDKLVFVKTDVTQWNDLVSLFKHGTPPRTKLTLPPVRKDAKDKHGRIDHVFANAGISGRADYLAANLDSNGDLQEPNHLTYDINLKGVINTSYLGLHHMRSQDPPGGSLVLTASASSFQRFRVVDYATAKHGVLGFMRGIVPQLQIAKLPIRCNTISPGWTDTGIVPPGLLKAAGIQYQSAEAVARSVAVLMADGARQGQLIYSRTGEYFEIEGKLLKVAEEIIGRDDDDGGLERMYALAANAGSHGA